MAYPFPPWIKPPGDLASAYISAYHAGAAVAGEQARLDQEAQSRATSLAVQQQRMQQQALRDQQHLEIQKSLSEAQLGLRQQQLGQIQQRIDATAASAARQLAAQQQYKRMRASGVPAEEAALSLPELFPSGSGLATMISAEQRLKQAQDRSASIVERPELPGYKILRQPTGYEQIVERPSKGLSLGEQISIQKEIARLTKEKSGLIATPRNRLRAAEIDAEIQNWKRFGQPTAPSEGGTQSATEPATKVKKFKYNPSTGTLDPVTEE